MTTTTRQSITFGHVYTDAKGRRFRADRFTPASETIVYGYLWDEKREAWGSRLAHRPVEDLTPEAPRTTPIPDTMWTGQDEDRKAANAARATERGLEPCEVCGRGVKAGSGWVITVGNGGSDVIHPDDVDSQVTDPGFMGSWVLGPECGKNVPLAFRTKWEGHTVEGHPTAAPEAQAPAGREPRTWDATTAETHTCAGACGQTLPARSFPTTGKDGRRGVVCRKDRDAARSAA